MTEQPVVRGEARLLGQDPGLSSDGFLDPEDWFISLRWIALVTTLALGSLAVFVFEFLPATAWPRIAGVVGLLAILNVIYLVLRRRGEPSSKRLVLQACADLVLLTALIHYSGGIENPVVLLMLFHVIIAGIALSKLQCYGIAVFATLLVGLLAAGEASGVLEHYTLRLVPHYEEHGVTAHAAYDVAYVTGFVGLHAAVLFLTAYFVTQLVGRLRTREQELAVSVTRARTQRKLLEQSLETTETGLYVCDAEFEPVLLNSRWTSWRSQYRSDTELSALFSGESIPEDLGDETSAVEVSGSGDEGRTFLATTASILDNQGERTHVVQLVRDVTGRKRAERQMIRAGQLAAVGELAGQVAHEVNNPIAIISAKGRLLLEDQSEVLADRVAKEVSKIVRLADRVGEIASGLLSYSRPSGAARGPVDLTLPVRSALSLIEQRATGSGIQIKDGIPEVLPPVQANHKEMEQVFLNLFLNALDAMEGRGELRLEARIPEDGTLEITIRDTGSGIPPEIASRIYEPFFTTKPEGRGTGLGLSICQGLVQHHDGSIEIESDPSVGTAVTLRFPLVSPN